MPDTSTIAGTVASALTISAFFPQALRSWKTRSTRDLSYGTVLLLVLQSAAWLTYGLLLKDPALIVTNSVTLLCALAILGAKVKYG